MSSDLDPMTRQALAFVVRLTSGEATEADAEALKGWRASGAAQEQAYREAVHLWKLVGKADIAAPRPTATIHAFPQKMGRRNFLRSGALAASVAGLAVVAGGYGVLGPSMGALFADYRTAVGERRTVELPDGSRIDLNTRTALSVRFSDQERRIDLIEGEALFTVTPDKSRPFVVHAAAGRTTAVGTVFSVHREDSQVSVTCVEGMIDVAANRIARLTAGQRIRYGRDLGDVSEIDAQIATAWSKGLLIFRDERLGKVIEEVNRYRSGWIVIVDPKRADHRVTGVFHLDRTEELLHHIEQTLGVSETRITNRLIVLS